MWFPRLFVLLILLVAACGRSADATDPAAPRDTPSRRSPPSTPTATPLPAPLPEVDSSALSEDEKRAFFQLVGSTNSPCGQPVSIERCVREGTACTDCRHAARYAVRLLSEGYPAESVKELLRFRYAQDTRVELSSEGCAWRGASMARVSIVEFADFECPHCKLAHETFDALFADPQFAAATRLCYRFFPLGGHENARPAARAAVAAMNQGKFWPMHDLLYDNQEALSPSAYTQFAGRIGLDAARFQADFDAPATDARVQRDRDEGDRVQIEGTPAIFVNGRRYEASPDPDSIRAYVREELER